MFHWDAYYLEYEASLANREWRADRVELPMPRHAVLIWLGAVFLPAIGLGALIGWLA